MSVKSSHTLDQRPLCFAQYSDGNADSTYTTPIDRIVFVLAFMPSSFMHIVLPGATIGTPLGSFASQISTSTCIASIIMPFSLFSLLEFSLTLRTGCLRRECRLKAASCPPIRRIEPEPVVEVLKAFRRSCCRRIGRTGFVQVGDPSAEGHTVPTALDDVPSVSLPM
ncbi:hypothetical protein OE88DRAFT_1469966 [Heliocybe sulcata]|uniref:Uncharacterized protein n=1 Tax=Heliocybe sulcata TaxID=5364 RepID=A0A5C3NE34_9AGAM|nr:hypothetical protein OE88DRAFT_1469966 [Heliocybe sulcata]